MRTQRHTTILDMFPHECLCVRLRRKGRSFSLPFAPSHTLTPHIYTHHVSASDATSDESKREKIGVICTVLPQQDLAPWLFCFHSNQVQTRSERLVSHAPHESEFTG